MLLGFAGSGYSSDFFSIARCQNFFQKFFKPTLSGEMAIDNQSQILGYLSDQEVLNFYQSKNNIVDPQYGCLGKGHRPDKWVTLIKEILSEDRYSNLTQHQQEIKEKLLNHIQSRQFDPLKWSRYSQIYAISHYASGRLNLSEIVPILMTENFNNAYCKRVKLLESVKETYEDLEDDIEYYENRLESDPCIQCSCCVPKHPCKCAVVSTCNPICFIPATALTVFGCCFLPELIYGSIPFWLLGSGGCCMCVSGSGCQDVGYDNECEQVTCCSSDPLASCQLDRKTSKLDNIKAKKQELENRINSGRDLVIEKIDKIVNRFIDEATSELSSNQVILHESKLEE